MAVQRKKDGSPNVRFFESTETIAQFDSVKTWLQKNCKKVRITRPAQSSHKCYIFAVFFMYFLPVSIHAFVFFQWTFCPCEDKETGHKDLTRDDSFKWPNTFPLIGRQHAPIHSKHTEHAYHLRCWRPNIISHMSA